MLHHLARRQPELFLEGGGKVFFAAEADHESYLRHIAFLVFQQFHSPVEAVVPYEFCGALVGECGQFSEKLTEMGWVSEFQSVGNFSHRSFRVQQ